MTTPRHGVYTPRRTASPDAAPAWPAALAWTANAGRLLPKLNPNPN